MCWALLLKIQDVSKTSYMTVFVSRVFHTPLSNKIIKIFEFPASSWVARFDIISYLFEKFEAGIQNSQESRTLVDVDVAVGALSEATQRPLIVNEFEKMEMLIGQLNLSSF